MAIQTDVLDPNAQSYTDDEIVGKVNAASANITRADCVEGSAQDWTGKDTDDLSEGTGNAYFPSAAESKLNGIENGATQDQDGDEIVTAINGGSSSITREDALSQDDLNIVKTSPTSGQFKVKDINRQVDGKYAMKYDDVAV